MNNTWFSADLHIGHANVIKNCKRPFDSMEQMHDTLIANINLHVLPNDVLYLLGDVCWNKKFLPLFDLIECQEIHLLLGNHDHENVRKCSRWASVKDLYRLKYNDWRLMLAHYPQESWNGRERGSIHLHGHCHNNMSHKIMTLPRRYDVGVDCYNMCPVNIDTIIGRAETDADYGYHLQANQLQDDV